MSTDATSAAGSSEALVVDAQHHTTSITSQMEMEPEKQPQPAFLHSPPDSNNAEKSEPSDSELSDLEEEPVLDDAPVPPPAKPEVQDHMDAETDIGEVLPDHWSGSVPVFRPTMDQFKDFKLFMQKVDGYGMKSGIIKIIPPTEWRESQPPLDDLIKQVRVREPIKQDIMGSNGTYRQVNILHGRSYNVPQWRQLCEQSEHQPPARRGERRANAERPKQQRARAAAAKSAPSAATSKSRRGRPPKNKGRQQKTEDDGRPMTPVSPKVEVPDTKNEIMPSVENDPGHDEVDDDVEAQPTVRRMGGLRPVKPKTQSTSARRKYGRREGSAVVDETAFRDFDYQMDISDYTPERCEELERVYWKTLTYAPPLYGADLMGTLFDDRTEVWNLNKLPNILDVLGTKVPGVNTAYLYLGMWKATFAWHLEDVDLYSINYLHFGAPKQWYSISQADARRFEAAMKSIWPADAKACDQFLRHKAFLISPQHLLQNFGIKVNKCISYPGEFVVTYPYGYHSGYNLGYNCAEAVNFALDSWLEMGKIAKKCECAQAQDSVWINVDEIERKLRGEDTEYEETEEEDDEDDESDEDVDGPSGLPTPPASHGVKLGRKRKRGPGGKAAKVKVKKIKLRLKVKTEPPCCLCPNDIPDLEILPTNHGRKAHRLCALYLPETYIDVVDGKEVISNVNGVHKDRLDLKCLYCRSKRGACFQCSQSKCARAYHATCAAAAGVFIEEQDVPVFGEDGTEYKEQAFEFSCRFHRTKRDRKLDGHALEEDVHVLAAAQALKKGEICQMQFYKAEIFAGVVVENRPEEQTLLLDVLPNGDRIEIEWKWLLLPNPCDFRLPKASARAIPMPASRKAKDQLNAKRHDEDRPRKDDVFVEGGFTWAEFNTQDDVANKDQGRVDFSKADQIWHYLGKTSTEAKAQFTEDPSKPRFNPKGNFLDTLPKPPKPAPAPRPYRQQYEYVGSTMYSQANAHLAPQRSGSMVFEKPYSYHSRQLAAADMNMTPMYAPQRFAPSLAPVPAPPPPSFPPNQHHPYPQAPTYQTSNPMPAYSPQYSQHHPPAQVPAASAVPPPVTGHGGWQTPGTMPATTTDRGPSMSSQPPQHVKPTWQVHSSIFQKYPFYQINHNRDSSRYRTPYAPWGGFTNGYQGDLRAHLMENQQDLLRRSSIGSLPSGASQTTSLASTMPGPKPASVPTGVSLGTVTTSQAPPPSRPLPTQEIPLASPPASAGSPSHAGHPAIKAQYRNLVPQGTPTPTSTPPASKPKAASASASASASAPAPTLAPKPYKVGLPAAISLSLKSTKPAVQVPVKQSPVPLPANFLAAMTSLPNTPSSSSSPSPLPPQSHASSIANPGHHGAAAKRGRMSTTPVPLPTFSRPPSQNMGQKSPARVLPESKESGGSLVQTSPPPSQQEKSVNTSAPSGMTLPVAEATASGQHDVHNHLLDVSVTAQQPQEFPDVPGCESMEFVERMIGNLRRASQRRGAS